MKEIMDIHNENPEFLYLSLDYNWIVCQRSYRWNNKLKRYLPAKGYGASRIILDFSYINNIIRKIKIENILCLK